MLKINCNTAKLRIMVQFSKLAKKVAPHEHLEGLMFRVYKYALKKVSEPNPITRRKNHKNTRAEEYKLIPACLAHIANRLVKSPYYGIQLDNDIVIEESDISSDGVEIYFKALIAGAMWRSYEAFIPFDRYFSSLQLFHSEIYNIDKGHVEIDTGREYQTTNGNFDPIIHRKKFEYAVRDYMKDSNLLQAVWQFSKIQACSDRAEVFIRLDS